MFADSASVHVVSTISDTILMIVLAVFASAEINSARILTNPPTGPGVGGDGLGGAGVRQISFWKTLQILSVAKKTTQRAPTVLVVDVNSVFEKKKKRDHAKFAAPAKR